MRALVAFFTVMVGLIVYGGYALYQYEMDQRAKFRVFIAAHDCKITSYMSGSTSTSAVPVITTNGQIGVGINTVTIPAKEAWSCNDGVTYWVDKGYGK